MVNKRNAKVSEDLRKEGLDEKQIISRKRKTW